MAVRKVNNEAVNYLNLVDRISLGARNSGLKREFLQKYCLELTSLSVILNISKLQAVFFCSILTLNFGNSGVDLDEVATYLDISPIKMLSHLKDLEEMVAGKVLLRHDTSRRRRQRFENINSIEFIVNREVIEALGKGEKFVNKKQNIREIAALMSYVDSVFADFRDGGYTREEMMNEIMDTVNANRDLRFVQELDRYTLNDIDIVMFLLIASDQIDDDEPVDLVNLVKIMYSDISERMSVRKEFLRGSHILLRTGLLKLEDGNFSNDKELSITETGLELLLQDDKDLIMEQKDRSSKTKCIRCNDINEKALFFSGTEQNDLAFITETLHLDNYNNLIKRMEEAGMRSGITILLYGPPGTGKTESVYQLARKTGRDIYMISVSETKSMWFGESEKLIKQVFDEYRKKAEKSKITPILLFNEADAIFSTRKKVGNSAVDQTENAIQNIILQELEDLKGILIATTNLTQNLDPAFERRFLYKICFGKPEINSRKHIWSSNISSLKEEDALMLASTFELSGGQIENVSRKCFMHQVLYGVFPPVDLMMNFCREEKLLRKEAHRIGFEFASNDLKIS